MIRRPQQWFVRVAGLIVTRLGIARTSKLAGFGGLTVVLLMAALAGGVEKQLLGLEKANELVLTAMPVAVVVAVLALALMWTVGLEARRREAATAAELELLEGQARTDSLTGAGNHRAFQEDLTQALQDGDPPSRISLAMIDLVGLKRVNDARGHHVGDERLRLVADCVRRLSSEERLYRVGGDEFAVVLADTSAWEAFQLAELERHAGTQFDPECVHALVRAISSPRVEELPLPAALPAT